MNERWHYDRKYSNCNSNGDEEQLWKQNVKPYLLHAYHKKKKQNGADDEASAYGKAWGIILSFFLWGKA